MRSRAGPRRRPGTVPQWLSEFTLTDWYDPAEAVPLAEQVEHGEVRWRCLRAYQRWRQAGLDWLGEAGYDDTPAGWRRAVWPGDWSADPHRLAKQVSHEA